MSTDEQKIQKVEAVVNKLKKIASASIDKSKLRKAMDAVTAASFILEEYNQYYIDDDLEEYTQRLADVLADPGFSQKETNKGTVLYYDSFGFDVRGLVIIYMHALVNLGYKIIYVTQKGSENKQPQLHEAVKGGDVTWEYVSWENRLEQANAIKALFEKHRPEKAFLYSTPDDTAAIAVFTGYQGVVDRFKINLTDHAFWLGTKSFDYNLEFRNYGSCVSNKYRRIGKERIILMPYYPYHKPHEFEGLPFDSEGKKVMFSGGYLYKTLGDPQNRYYRIVRTLLQGHEDLIYLYAGAGDDSELKKVSDEFPGRVYHINERNDLYELMGHCTFYLNTFPMIGGLMMQFAADAGKLPLTLRPDKKNVDADGILFNQEQIEYATVEELTAEADKLLEDEEYRLKRGEEIKKCMITPDEFREALGAAVERHESVFQVEIKDIDTSDFRAPYIARFDESNFRKVIASGNKLSLLPNFPGMFLSKVYNRIIKNEKLN